MIKPAPLKKGDKVAFIGTSSPAEEYKIKSSMEFFRSLGLEVILGNSCNRKYGYLSGIDEIRADDLNSMFNDNGIRGIFAIRGGYGASRLLDMIDYNVVRNNPKVFVGYSDVTILHLALNQKCNLITYHGPMPTTEFYKDIDSFTKGSLVNSIFLNEPLCEIKNPDTIKIETLYGGTSKGIITGGNLSLICSSLGTKYEIDTRGKILFLEEVGEEPYRIDRMFLQLKQSGKLSDASGIVLGSFTDCEAKYPDKSLTLKEVIKELILPMKKPSILNLSFGHCDQTLTIPMGSMAELNASSKKLRIIE